MSLKYGIVKEIYSVENMSRISYGIVAFADFESEGTNTVVASFHDVSSDRESLEKLINLCNRMRLSIIHLNDVVYDYLSK